MHQLAQGCVLEIQEEKHQVPTTREFVVPWEAGSR